MIIVDYGNKNASKLKIENVFAEVPSCIILQTFGGYKLNMLIELIAYNISFPPLIRICR